MKLDDPVVPEVAFRIHRHDVMNVLQVVKAYIQLGKPEQALTSVNHLADWLTSLSVIQSHFPEDTDLLWESARSPHVRVRSVSNVPGLSAALRADLVDCVRTLEELVREHTNEPASVWLDGMEDTANGAANLGIRVQFPKVVADLLPQEALRKDWPHIKISCEHSAL